MAHRSRDIQLGMSVLCGKKYADCIAPNMQWKYGAKLLETNHPISFHRGLDT